MVRKNTAQVMLEYLIMAILVMAAIIFGGPFLVNSIGARFRIAENNAGDAFGEKLEPAALEACVCVPRTNDPRTWGPPGACGAGCSGLEKKWQRSCSPPACSMEWACLADAECCDPAQKGACGTILPGQIPALTDGGGGAVGLPSLCATREVLDPVAIALFPAGAEGRCVDSGGGVRGCKNTERSYSATCGQGKVRFACVVDLTCPDVGPGNIINDD